MNKLLSKISIVVCLIGFLKSSYCQDTIPVFESTFKMKGNSEELFYFGFAKGDKIIIELEETSGKPIKEFELTECPSTSKFMDYKTSKISKNIFVPRKAVYEFRVSTAPLASRICRIRISRIPKDETTYDFNSAWEWKTVYDTTYIPYTEDSIVGYDTIYYKENVRELLSSEISEVTILDENAIVHSLTSAEGQYYNKRFSLPKNWNTNYESHRVVSWAYWVGVGDEANQAWQRGVKAVSGIAQTAAASYATPLGAAALGAVFDWAMPTTGENVQYEIKNNYGRSLAMGNCISTKGVVSNDGQLQGDYLISLYNDNKLYKIAVKLLVVAMVETKTYHDVAYDRRKIVPRTVSLNKIRMNVDSREIRINAE